MKKTFLLGLITLMSVFVFSNVASSATVFWGPTPYLSEADIPEGFYQNGSPTALENFEDGTLDFGISASLGIIVPPIPSGYGFGIDATDSVDGDDGVIDGYGSSGHSFFSDYNPSITFTFSLPVSAAGLVFTDGGPTSNIIFEAFGENHISLGTLGPYYLGDSTNIGSVADDYFFGVQDSNGIHSISLTTNYASIEVDHLQYESMPTPVPGSFMLFGSGLIGLVGSRIKRKKSA